MKTSNPSWQKRWGRELVALLGGVLYPLAFAPFQFYWLAPLCLALLFYSVHDETRLKALLLRGWLFGMGMFGVGVSWVYVVIHDFGYTGMVLAVLMTLLFVAFMALFPVLAMWIHHRLLRRSHAVPAMTILLLLPLSWLLMEWTRGWLLTGFPWLQAGFAMTEGPLQGYAPVTGVLGLTAIVSWSGALVLWAGLQQRRWRWVSPLLIVLWGTGWALDTVQWTTTAGEPLKVSLVQGSLPQITKWDDAQIKHRLETYASLTQPEMGEVDVVVWPENSVTVYYQHLKDSYFAPLAEQARNTGTDLILGLPVVIDDEGRYHTSMMTLGRSQGFYHKRHLVPFGEYVPLESVLRGLIAFFDLPMSGFSPGPAEQDLLKVADQPALVTICYEDAFSAEWRHDAVRASLLINGSNNAWYGDSLAQPQHLQIARMGTLEAGRPLLRATTNGISALVNHRGEVLARAPQFQTHVLRGVVQPMQGATPYLLLGNYPLLGLMAVLLIGIWLRGAGKKI